MKHFLFIIVAIVFYHNGNTQPINRQIIINDSNFIISDVFHHDSTISFVGMINPYHYNWFNDYVIAIDLNYNPIFKFKIENETTSALAVIKNSQNYFIYCEDVASFNCSAYLIKLDLSGNVISTFSFNKPSCDYYEKAKMTFDSNGNILILSSIYQYSVIHKFDTNLNIVWRRKVWVPFNGGKNPGLDFVNVTEDRILFGAKAYSDLHLFLLDYNGNLQWSKRFKEFDEKYTLVKKIKILENKIHIMGYRSDTTLYDGQQGGFYIRLNLNFDVEESYKFVYENSNSGSEFIPTELFIDSLNYHYFLGFTEYGSKPRIWKIDQNFNSVETIQIQGGNSNAFPPVYAFSEEKFVFTSCDGSLCNFQAINSFNEVSYCDSTQFIQPSIEVWNIDSLNIDSSSTILNITGNSVETILLSSVTDFEIEENCNPLSILDNSSTRFYVIPNPVHSILYFETDNLLEMISIFDIQGNLIDEYQYVSHLNVSSYSSGLYLVRCKLGEQYFTQKFIKE